MLDHDAASQLISYWNDGSRDDYETAQEIFAHTERFASALFYAHLAVEKRLKALFVERFRDHAPYTHNLIHLATRIGLEVDDGILVLLTQVNEFNLQGRYPDQKGAFRKKCTRSFAQNQLKNVDKVLQWISQISSQESSS